MQRCHSLGNSYGLEQAFPKPLLEVQAYYTTAEQVPKSLHCFLILNRSQHPVDYVTPRATTFPNPPPERKSFLRRAINVLGLALVFSSAGFAIAAYPAFRTADEILTPVSDKETLTRFTPTDPKAIEVEAYINNHPLVKELRSRPELSESRPHLRIPVSQRGHNLTGGTLMGPGRVVVPPYVWLEAGGKSLVSISYLGEDLCGHPNIVHGGFLATMLDEGLGRCCFGALPNKIGMTATLKVDYKAPTMAGQYVVLKAKTVKVEGRKAWVEGTIETLVGEGETPKVLCKGEALFIEPKQAANMARIYPVT
ncbi:thioesterase superfamily protein [Rutstroemia sp. NJR-2017a BVV2]|nr:thioesterase superfamily protein [Rutstroemia sp. NJR-2017a BVV2]